jgi:hypothetical protein
VIDDWVAEPSDLPFILNSKGDATLEFTITPGTHTYNALYPIHAYINYKLDNKECQLHPILYFKPIFLTRLNPICLFPGNLMKYILIVQFL